MAADATLRRCQCWLQDGVNSGFVIAAVCCRVQWHFFQDGFIQSQTGSFSSSWWRHFNETSPRTFKWFTVSLFRTADNESYMGIFVKLFSYLWDDVVVLELNSSLNYCLTECSACSHFSPSFEAQEATCWWSPALGAPPVESARWLHVKPSVYFCLQILQSCTSFKLIYIFILTLWWFKDFLKME